MSTDHLTSFIKYCYSVSMVDDISESITFVEGVTEENATQEIWRSLNKLYSHISHLVNYKYHLLLYRLVRKGVKMEDLMFATGYSRQRIYTIVTEFERREMGRIHKKDKE